MAPASTTAGAATVEEVSAVAFGFMGSKALFVALHLGLFDKLAAGPRSLDQLASDCGCNESTMQKVVAANMATRLLVHAPPQASAAGGGGVAQPLISNAPATSKFLVRGAPGDCGDYYRYQIDQQIWPVLSRLDASLAIQRTGQPGGTIDSHWYATAMEDPKEAALFTESQHAGSLGAAAFLAKRIQLPANGPPVLLDVAGGSGAFSIALCKRNKELRSVLMDFSEVARTATRFVEEAGLSSRIACHGGNAISDAWPADPAPNMVLLSYLLSAVQEKEVGAILAKAWDALRPGGLLVIHDFLLDAAAAGPSFAALWLFTHEAITPGSPTLTGPTLITSLQRQGFVDIQEQPALPDITSFVFAVKPGAGTAAPAGSSSAARREDPASATAAVASPVPAMATFSCSIVVRYSECDMQGVVFNAHYLAWADEATDQFVRSRLGREYEKELPFEYMWKKAEVTFHKPAKHMDRIDISVAITRWGNTSCTFLVSGQNQAGEECFTAENVAVCVDRETHSPTPFTADMKARLSTDSKL